MEFSPLKTLTHITRALSEKKGWFRIILLFNSILKRTDNFPLLTNREFKGQYSYSSCLSEGCYADYKECNNFFSKICNSNQHWLSLKMSMSILLFSLIMKLFKHQSSMNVLFLLGEHHINMERVVKPLVVLNKWISSTKIIYLNTCIQMFMINSSERCMAILRKAKGFWLVTKAQKTQKWQINPWSKSSKNSEATDGLKWDQTAAKTPGTKNKAQGALWGCAAHPITFSRLAETSANSILCHI